MKWIKGKDSLPEIKEIMLIRVVCGDSFNVESGKYMGNDRWINCWFSSRIANTYPVTHWMPLPEPPELEK